jgi:hypothetical protein
MDAYDYIVVGMVAQHIWRSEYHVGKWKKGEGYTLMFLRNSHGNTESDFVTVEVESTITELHLKVHLCAREQELNLLAKISARNLRNSLVQNNPTVNEFVDMLEKHSVFDEAKNVDEGLLHSIAMYGARERPLWLQEPGDKYVKFLGQLRYAQYEALFPRTARHVQDSEQSYGRHSIYQLQTSLR